MAEISVSQAAELQRYYRFREGRLVIWSVLHGLKEFGDRYVARPIISPSSNLSPVHGWLLADNLDELRKKLPAGLTRMPRHRNQDPAIIETWF